MNRAQLPTKRRLPSNIIVSDETVDDDIVSITTSISDESKPVPPPKPKPRHHRDFARTINDLHATDHVTDSDLQTTTSDLHTTVTSDLCTKSISDSHTKTTGDVHTKTTGDLYTKTTGGDLHTNTSDLCTNNRNGFHTKTTSDLHTVGPLTHTNTTSSTAMGWSTPSPKLKPKLVSSTNSITSIDTTTTAISGQAKIRTSDVHVKPLTTVSELQTTGTTRTVQAYSINTNIDNAATKTTSVKLQAKPHVTSKQDLHLMTDSHAKIDTDDKFHARTTDNVHASTTKHVLDVVSDHVVEETDIGWSSTHRVTTNDEVVNEQQRRLKGTML